MDAFGILLNYLDISKFLVILIIMFMVAVIRAISYVNLSFFFGIIVLKSKKNTGKPSQYISIDVKEDNHNTKQKKRRKSKIQIQGFYQNEILESQKTFCLGEKTKNVEHLNQILNNCKNNSIEKKDEISIMFVESLSSLNSWGNNEVENEIFKEVHWILEKNESQNNAESLVYQYIYPPMKSYPNYEKVNIYPEDGEKKEEELLSAYKLGICRIFKEDESHLKSNIVKEVNGNLFKIYSEGDPNLIKEKCRKETIPGNFSETLQKYKEKGYNIIGLAGKKMKMNYLQSQRIDRSICESNMIFLGFAIYKVIIEDYKSSYSWCLIIILDKKIIIIKCNIINFFTINEVNKKTFNKYFL